ncbi:unnamed protein product [Sphagnum balticum]
MRWILEKAIDVEVGTINFLTQELDAWKQPYSVIQFVPFSHELFPEVDRSENLFPLGTTSLIRLAQQEHWKPGVFLNYDFDQRIWSRELTAFTLNESTFSQLADAVLVEDKMFIRPTSPINSFGGQVVSRDCFDAWRESAYELPTNGYDSVTPDTMVALSPVKKIDSEYQVFVVSGKPVTASRYRFHGVPMHRNADLNNELLIAATAVCDHWLPHPHCVLDFANTEQGMRLIEINCLNCSGFYRCDIRKLVSELVNATKAI